MIPRCRDCKKQVIDLLPSLVYTDWLKLFHYFETEYTEGHITELTFNTMTEALVTLQPDVDIRVLKAIQVSNR